MFLDERNACLKAQNQLKIEHIWRTETILVYVDKAGSEVRLRERERSRIPWRLEDYPLGKEQEFEIIRSSSWTEPSMVAEKGFS